MPPVVGKNPETETEEHVFFSRDAVPVKANDLIRLVTPGGGGWGDPLERDPVKVLDDVLDGFFGPEHAKSDYGVVLKPVDNGYDWGLDEVATINLRAEMRP